MPGRRKVQPAPRRTIHGGARGGFTLTEVLIVVGILIVLVGLLLPALGGVWSTGQMTQSMNNLRQVGGWMQQYSVDHNDFIVPSRFDHSDPQVDPYPGKVRSRFYLDSPGNVLTGTWADVLHVAGHVWKVAHDHIRADRAVAGCLSWCGRRHHGDQDGGDGHSGAPCRDCSTHQAAPTPNSKTITAGFELPRSSGARFWDKVIGKPLVPAREPPKYTD